MGTPGAASGVWGNIGHETQVLYRATGDLERRICTAVTARESSQLSRWRRVSRKLQRNLSGVGPAPGARSGS